MQERTSLEDALSGIGKVERELEDNIGMIELGEAENDSGVVAEAETALKNLKKEVARRELEALLSGEADRFDSYLEVHAGAGGTESQDWAAMLLRMYSRWAEKHGFKIEYLEETQGEEAGIKSATIQISGQNAYGWLRPKAACIGWCGYRHSIPTRAGIHRSQASRVSGRRRQHQDRHQGIRRTDRYMRSGGAGGQHVNKTEFGGKADPYSDRGRGGLPGRTFPAQEPRRRPGTCCAPDL